MKRPGWMKTLFARYVSVGMLNTAVHWLVFLALHELASWPQSLSNLLAFGAAATFSYYANAFYTFKAPTSGRRYLMFVGFMGALSLAVGYLADQLQLPALVTLVLFSAISLVLGFFYSSLVIYRKGKS